MPKRDDGARHKNSGVGKPTAQELRAAIDHGATNEKVAFPDPAAAPLGTDDEAAGTPDAPFRIATAFQQELSIDGQHSGAGADRHAPERRFPRPMSPNIQIYRPQLTSVLSIANRMTGLLLSIGTVGLVGWLMAAASGPRSFAVAQAIIFSWPGQIVLFGFTFAFFLHLCGGIRHLIWDTVHGFDLRSIYASGWAVVAASIMLTLATWAASLLLDGH